MKAFRTPQGNYINLSLCNRFFVRTYENGFEVKAVLDLSEDDEITYSLTGLYEVKQEAQDKLDEIMEWIIS